MKARERFGVSLPARSVYPAVRPPAFYLTMRDRADLVEQVDLEHLSQDDSSIVSDGEGGLQAWLTITGSFLVYFASFGYMNSFGFFQDYYQQHYLSEYAPSLIALIGTLQLGLMYLVGPVAGVLFDAYGFQVRPALAASHANSSQNAKDS